MAPLLKQVFNRHFFFVASMLNSICFLFSYESHVKIDLEKSHITIEYINLGHIETIKGSTANFLSILKNNDIRKNPVLKLSDIKTNLSQRDQYSVISIGAEIQDSSILLDKLGFFYHKEKIVYKPSPSENIIQSNGNLQDGLLKFNSNIIEFIITRSKDNELLEEWRQLAGEAEELNNILKY